MSWTVIIVLILVGLVFIVLEILVIPGVGVAGILGTALIVFAIWETYSSHGKIAGIYTIGFTVLITAITLFFSFKSKTWKRMMLSSKIDSKVNIVDKKKLKIGDVGVTVSRLVPGGKALINGNFYEVHSTGDFIDPKTEIVVNKITFNKIIVKPKT